MKLDHITAAVVKELTTSCAEGVPDMIDNQFFVCYEESPSFVTYRARLEGTSETDSGSLISLIEQWVKSGASVIVTGVLMTVDSDCSVAISHLSEPECSPPPSPSPSPSPDTQTPLTPALKPARIRVWPPLTDLMAHRLLGGVVAIAITPRRACAGGLL